MYVSLESSNYFLSIFGYAQWGFGWWVKFWSNTYVCLKKGQNKEIKKSKKKKRLRNNQTWKIKEHWQQVFFYSTCAWRTVTCFDDDDRISCGWVCDLKIFAMFIENLYLGQQIYLQCVLCTVFHHVYSCSIFSCAGRTVNCSDDDDWISFGCVCGLLLGRNFERWMIGKKRRRKQAKLKCTINYGNVLKKKNNDLNFKRTHPLREKAQILTCNKLLGSWSWLSIKNDHVLFFLL